jgi:hypothetical protein
MIVSRRESANDDGSRHARARNLDLASIGVIKVRVDFPQR